MGCELCTVDGLQQFVFAEWFEEEHCAGGGALIRCAAIRHHHNRRNVPASVAAGFDVGAIEGFPQGWDACDQKQWTTPFCECGGNTMGSGRCHFKPFRTQNICQRSGEVPLSLDDDRERLGCRVAKHAGYVTGE
jgi:hypothetical protein